jgi:three-Cys-motif partner protein
MIDPARYRGREQTFVKHFFLDRYLERVAYVTLAGSGRWSEFAYIDAFSGPWRSADENFEDTSVSIALTKLEAVRQGLQKAGRDVTFRALFVERDRSAFHDLQCLVARFPNSGARTICGEFQDQIEEARRFIGNAFSLVFIDPTGWSLDLSILQPLLRLRGEVILNFMYNDINRHLDNPQPGIRASFDPIFGGPSWRSEIEQRIGGGEDREAAIIGVLCDRLRQAGGSRFVTSTRILWPVAERTYFYLVYATRHWRGLEEFRKVEQETLDVQEQARFDARLQARQERSGMGDLFDGAGPTGMPRELQARRVKSISKARQSLRDLLLKQGQFVASEAFGCMLEQPLVFPDDARRLLVGARDAGWLTLELGPRERTPKPETLVRKV